MSDRDDVNDDSRESSLLLLYERLFAFISRYIRIRILNISSLVVRFGTNFILRFCLKLRRSFFEAKKISRSISVTSLVINFLLINGVVAFYARRERTNAPSVVVVLLFFETRERESFVLLSRSFCDF